MIGFYGEIEDIPYLKMSRKKTLNLILKIKTYKAHYFNVSKNNDIELDVKTKILCYFPYKYAKDITIYKGDIVYIRGWVNYTEDIYKDKEFKFFADYLREKKISAISILNKENFNIVKQTENIFTILFHNIRTKAFGILDSYIYSDRNAILKGIFFGEARLIPKEIRSNFNNTGVAHILAVSGLHVGFILLIFTFIFKLFRIKKKWIFLLVLIPLAFYWGIVGLKISVTRAIIMYIALFVISNRLERKNDSLNNLFLAGIIILMIDPESLFEIGFQLSFSAVAGILIFFPLINNIVLNLLSKVKIFKNIIYKDNNKWYEKFIKYVVGVLIVSIASDLVLTPIIAYHFNVVILSGLITNTVIIPICFILVCMGALFYLTYFISAFLATYISYAIDWLVYFMKYFVSQVASLGFLINIEKEIYQSLL